MFDFLSGLGRSIADVFGSSGAAPEPQPQPQKQSQPPPPRAAGVAPSAVPGDTSGVHSYLVDDGRPPPLAKMPEQQRVKLLAGMDDKKLDEMAAQAVGSAEQRGQLEAALQHTEDPTQKLRLWAALETAKLKATSEALTLGGGHNLGDDKRLKAAEDGLDEVQKEKARYLRAIAMYKESGKPMPKEVIDTLIKRKAHERDIETKYGVNLRYDMGERDAADPHTAWDDAYLDQVDATLARIPPEVLAKGDIPAIRLVAEDRTVPEEERDTSSGVTDNETGEIRIFKRAVDRGLSATAGDTSDLAGTDKVKGAQTLELTLAHEIGHAVMDRDDNARTKLEAAAGVKDHKKGDDLPDDLYLKCAKLKEGEQLEHEGRIYTRAHKHITSVPVDHIPTGGSHTGGFEREQEDNDLRLLRKDVYGYARSSVEEYHGEMFTLALNNPENLHKDFVTEPATRVKHLEDQRNILQARLANAEKEGRGDAGREAVRRNLEATERSLAQARDVQASRSAQVQSLREDTFGLKPQMVSDAHQKIVAAGGNNPAAQQLVQEYDQLACQAMTPQQLDKLTEEYQRKIAAAG